MAFVLNTYVVIIFVCVYQIGRVKQLKLRYLGTIYKTPIYVWLFKQKSKRKYNHLFWCVFKYYAPWAIVFRGYVCPRVMPQQCLVTWWLRSWRQKIWRGYFLSPSVSHFQTYILRHSVCNKCHMCTEIFWIYVLVRKKCDGVLHSALGYCQRLYCCCCIFQLDPNTRPAACLSSCLEFCSKINNGYLLMGNGLFLA